MEEYHRENLVIRVLEALKKACRDLQGGVGGAPDTHRKKGEEAEDDNEDDPCNSPSMKALLVLQTESDGLLSCDPHLSTLSHLLSHLKSLAASTTEPDGGGLGSGIGGLLSSLLLHLRLLPSRRRRRSRSSCSEISRVAGSIESEIQSWIDRESLDRLVPALRSHSFTTEDEERLAGLLLAFEDRLSRGFDGGLQDAVLRSGAFPAVASVLAEPTAPARLRERCASAVAAMVRFNRDVFVGPVMMGGGGGDSSVLRSLVSMGTPASVRALRALVASIRSPLIDEIHAEGQIPRVVGFLSSPEVEVRVPALDLALEIGYYGRKEAVEAMLEAGVIKRLVALQRSELGGALIEMDDGDDDQADGDGKRKGRSREGRYMEKRPFASCIARFAIQVEVGEGLRRREKGVAKQEILGRVREAVISDAEAATILAEVLWGATP